jgi:16S rRNA (cytosine967-C5)-methyltransferase
MHRDARRIARDVLARVGARGGYANKSLDAAFKKHRDLDPRDRALITEIVYGVLRRRATLDHHLAKFSRVPWPEVERATRDALRAALYQVLYLDRVPAAAAVSDAVDAVPFRAKGFVNAVLRSLLRDRGSLTCDDLADDRAEFLATVHSHPAWLVERWLARYGEERATALLAANNERPPLTLRTNLLRGTREELIARLHADGVEAAPSPIVPEAVRLGRVVDLEALAALRQGFAMIQDEAAMAVVHLLDPRPGERVLDACAAPGGKSVFAAERMGDRGEVVALDPEKARLLLVEQNACRLGLRAVKTRRGDATRLPEELSGFDRVLVDVPCSALGLLRKQPEIRWRRGLDDLADLAARQAAILIGAARAVRPGGVLVYAACTLEPEETGAVVDAFLASRGDFRLRPAGEVLTGTLAPLAAADGRMRTESPEWLMDGFFAARMEREAD